MTVILKGIIYYHSKMVSMNVNLKGNYKLSSPYGFNDYHLKMDL